jgi:DNA-binding NarL/FixJ family response regulator
MYGAAFPANRHGVIELNVSPVHVSVWGMHNPRVVLADDHQEVFERVAKLLEGKFDVVAAVENGLRVIEVVAKLNPDLVVLDISMPVLDGIETARLRASGYSGRVIFLTALEDCDFVAAAFSVGAFGYVVKSRLVTDLVPAIQRALQGQFFCSQFRSQRSLQL